MPIPNDMDIHKDVMIAAPCNVGWENMQGDEKVRFCQECKLNVFNTSKMSKDEVTSLLANDDNSCLRIYRRADGTIITEDCPRGLRRIRDGWRRLSKVAASIWALTVSISCAFAQNLPSAVEKSGVGKTDAVKTEASSEEKTGAVKAQASGAGRPGAAPRTSAVITPQGSPQRAAYFMTAKLLEKAQLSVRRNNTREADQYFKETIASLTAAGHDSAFEILVFSDYAEFLNSQNRSGEAKEILAKIAKLKMYNPEPTVIVGGRYASHRVKRQQKTIPTLPPGTPIPDSE